jgi:hypothetical protein
LRANRPEDGSSDIERLASISIQGSSHLQKSRKLIDADGGIKKVVDEESIV